MDNAVTIGMLIIQVTGLFLAFLAGTVLARLLGARKDSGSVPDHAGGIRIPTPVPAPLPADTGRLFFGHEMKNYLCVLKGNAKLLRLGVKSAHQAAIIDRIDRVVERLESFAWKEQAAAPDVLRNGRRECVDLLEAARSCTRIHFGPAGAEFPVMATDGSPYVQGDPHRLDQVLMNLYGNALEAGARKVTTRIRRIGVEIEVAIEDDGRGCSPDQARRIFHPSREASRPKTPGAPPRGLGLSIVRSIVGNHGGRLRVSVKNGRGDGETGLVVHLHFPAHVPLSAPSPDLRPPVVAGNPSRWNPSWETEKAVPPL